MVKEAIGSWSSAIQKRDVLQKCLKLINPESVIFY
jgi:hypothetical protein